MVQAAEESAVSKYNPTAKPGMGFVSVVLRYDNGRTDSAIQLFWEPWQMVGTDGVRRTASIYTSRNDTLVAGERRALGRLPCWIARF
jgi:hypothetical protein